MVRSHSPEYNSPMDDLDAARRAAVRVLGEAAAADRLSMDQLETRLQLVRHAPNLATLDAILADLAVDETPPAMVPAPRSSGTPAPIEPAESLRIATILSSSKRAGSWTVPLRLELKVILGELTIDLRDAVFCSDYLDVEVDALLGSLTILVPVGTQVENEAEERMSSTTHSTRSSRNASPIGLLIRITGRVRWSSLEIKEKPRKGEEPSAWRRLLGG